MPPASRRSWSARAGRGERAPDVAGEGVVGLAQRRGAGEAVAQERARGARERDEADRAERARAARGRLAGGEAVEDLDELELVV